MLRSAYTMLTDVEALQAQVERLLNSATFRNAEVLRRLLKFLADKSVTGETDQLKEYTIAVDGLGKPASYDPRQDSLVRIEIGRLRTKLSDYYRSEGENDPIILTIPKGHFKLAWAKKSPPTLHPPSQSPTSSTSLIAQGGRGRSKRYVFLLLILAMWAVTATTLWWQAHRSSTPLDQAWSPELRELWRPFLESRHPLIVAVSAPLFVGFQGRGFYRDQKLNEWDKVVTSSEVQALRKTLNDPPIIPRYYYTGLGEMSASFALGKLLGNSGLEVSTTSSNLLSWQQIVDDNVLFVGPPRVFGDQLHKVPVDLNLVLREDGIHDLKDKPNQPALFADNYPSIDARHPTVPDDGTVYALVSRMPGPLGSGYVQSFSSNHSPGTRGAVEMFTVPKFARQLIANLRKSDGRLPQFFQVVIRVRYRDAIPIEISYITHRVLQLRNSSNAANEPSTP
jgi:hypothetical protein